MRCPFCNATDTAVKDTRQAEDGACIRRRRHCDSCGARFTTFERIQMRDIMVVKSDGKKEVFKREKLLRSFHLPLQKRPVDEDRLQLAVNSIIRQLEASGEGEVTSELIGEKALHALYALDKIAYVRYASIYNDFQSLDHFNAFVDNLRANLPSGEEENSEGADTPPFQLTPPDDK